MIIKPSFTVGSDLHFLPHSQCKDLQLESVTNPTVCGGNVHTEYMLVYGTLRLGQGNWRYHLSENAEHVGTARLQGFHYMGGLACGYTGNPEHHAVFDLFKIVKNHAATNRSVDALEGVLGDDYETPERMYGGYKTCLLPLTLVSGDTEENIVAKFYHVNVSRLGDSEDYLKEGINSDRKMAAALAEAKANNLVDFLNFYSDETH